MPKKARVSSVRVIFSSRSRETSVLHAERNSHEFRYTSASFLQWRRRLPAVGLPWFAQRAGWGDAILFRFQLPRSDEQFHRLVHRDAGHVLFLRHPLILVENPLARERIDEPRRIQILRREEV